MEGISPLLQPHIAISLRSWIAISFLSEPSQTTCPVLSLFLNRSIDGAFLLYNKHSEMLLVQQEQTLSSKKFERIFGFFASILRVETYSLNHPVTRVCAVGTN